MAIYADNVPARLKGLGWPAVFAKRIVAVTVTTILRLMPLVAIVAVRGASNLCRNGQRCGRARRQAEATPYTRVSDPLTMMGSFCRDDPDGGTVLKKSNLLREGSRARERTTGAEDAIRPEGQYVSYPRPLSSDARGGGGFTASLQRETAPDCGLRGVTLSLPNGYQRKSVSEPIDLDPTSCSDSARSQRFQASRRLSANC